jgi:4-hydroxy-tetrahydrodipicolinate synthase
MPILLYNIPARTGNSIAPETVDRLAEISNIVGAKDSSGDWDNLKAYLDVSKKHEGFKILSGNDSLILKSLQEGGAGAIAGCANVYPNVMSSIFDLYQEGRIQEAEVVQNSIASFRSVFKFGNPNTIVKIAVNELGYHVGPCKAPFNELCKEGADLLKKVLAENSAAGMH